MFYTFLVNPHAHSGLGQSIWEKVETILKARQISYQVLFTKYQGHATKLVAKLCADHAAHTLVVLGGDGSINETINGIPDFDKVTLGYIPTGSGNDFARDLGIPGDPVKALEIILDPPLIRQVDIGITSYHDKKRAFAVSSGIGFDAAVCHQAVVSKMKLLLNKLKLGRLTYAGIALNRLILTTPGAMEIVIDEQPPLHFDNVYFVVAMNRRYEGGGFRFCPAARDNDGILNIMVIEGMSKRKVLALLPTAFFGFHVHFKGVHLYTGRHLYVHSKPALPVHVDGEPLPLQHNLQVSCATTRIHLITTR